MREAALHCCSETTTFILQRLSKTPNEPGWASSLTASCKGERSTQGGRSTQKSPLCQQSYAIGREMWTFPKAAPDKVCSGRSGEACCDCLEAWIKFWGIFRTTCCQESMALWHGLGTWSTLTFSRTHHQFQRAGLSPEHLCSRERASPSFYSWGM